MKKQGARQIKNRKIAGIVSRERIILVWSKESRRTLPLRHGEEGEGREGKMKKKHMAGGDSSVQGKNIMTTNHCPGVSKP